MPMITLGHDAIHANISHLPPGQAAGYTTGSSDIQWTDGDWKAHPGAVRICQDSGTDHTADWLDVERGAATNADAAAWAPRALAAYRAAIRPGQRSPAIYTSASNITPLVDALIAGGVKGGIGLAVANWSLGEGSASVDVEHAAGPFPIVAVQYASNAFYDSDVFSKAWLQDVSAAGPHKHTTDGTKSVTELAASRGMRPGGWLDLQDRIAGRAVADALAGEAVAAGLPWYSVSP